jgi:hypothetical protein
MAQLQKSVSTVGINVIDQCPNADMIVSLEMAKSLVSEDGLVVDVRYHWNCWPAELTCSSSHL